MSITVASRNQEKEIVQDDTPDTDREVDVKKENGLESEQDQKHVE